MTAYHAIAFSQHYPLTALSPYCTIPLLRHPLTALSPYCAIPLLHYPLTALSPYCAIPLLHYPLTALSPYCTIPLLRHPLTAPSPYCTIPLLHYPLTAPSPYCANPLLLRVVAHYSTLQYYIIISILRCNADSAVQHWWVSPSYYVTWWIRKKVNVAFSFWICDLWRCIFAWR